MSLFDGLSISRLLSQLVEELGQLVTKEVDLAKAEMAEKASTLFESAVPVFIAVAFLYAGVLVLLASAVFGLATVAPIWLSALIIGGIVTLAGFVATMRALRSWKKNPVIEGNRCISAGGQISAQK
ncbi:MAG: phage holin family protein [Desulfobacterales bacterium]